MNTRQKKARENLKKLEDDPKHTTENDDAKRQTRDDDLNDPKNHKEDGEIDPKWKKDAKGHWHHPDFE